MDLFDRRPPAAEELGADGPGPGAARLEKFKRDEAIDQKGPLCVALHVTRRARERGLPLDPAALITTGGGQVKGLGKARIQSILSDYGITRILAEEGGRTSRGSIAIMHACVDFLNGLNAEEPADVSKIEKWWIEQVRIFFASKPFMLRLDPAKSLKAVLHDLFEQALKRQRRARGFMILGAVLQHLVGATLETMLEPETLQHNGASAADSPTGRAGDFIIDRVVIHVTTAPGEALIRKCVDNINAGLRPIIITTAQKIVVAQELAAQSNVEDRIDVFEIEQFIAAKIYGQGRFDDQSTVEAVKELFQRYNRIVEACESDPGLKIKVMS